MITNQFSQPTSDSAGLGALLVLLHDAGAGPLTVEATYRVWRHRVRAHEAFSADAERQKRQRGSASFTYGSGRGEPQPDEELHTVRIWREGEKVREERHGGERDGYYAVADPPLWWMWDERMGAHSNEDDPSVGTAVGQDLELLFDPTPLLGSLRFQVTGTSEIAGRPTITAQATGRPADDRFGASIELSRLGTGADHYELEVDRERGVILAATAVHNGEPFQAITALAIKFDERIAADVFRFEPPEGEEIQSMRRRSRRMRSVTLVEAQQQAPFTVQMPDRVPADWQVHCTLIEPSKRPESSMKVALSYHSADGHESVSITQQAADASTEHGPGGDEEDWEAVQRDGLTIKTRPASWGQAQARLTREGTDVFLMSDNLTRDQLLTIAAGLRRAPSASSIQP